MLDKDNNKKISPEELIGGIAILTRGSLKDKASLTFDAFDLNKDGFLQANELKVQFEEVFRVAAKIAGQEAQKEGGAFLKVKKNSRKKYTKF